MPDAIHIRMGTAVESGSDSSTTTNQAAVSYDLNLRASSPAWMRLPVICRKA
jgi:hypothetical protein